MREKLGQMKILIKWGILFFLFLIFPFETFADRGIFIWPPEIHLNQSAQNAIVTWNGKEEIIILSTNFEKNKFCGWSSYGECVNDSDCRRGGCSKQVCESKNEGVITTCEWKDCYDAKKYGKKCQCIKGKCQWANKDKEDKEVLILEVLPLPSKPTKVKSVSANIFEKLVTILNEKIKKLRSDFLKHKEAGERAFNLTPSIEIVFEKTIGAHNITIVKVNNLNYFLNWIDEFAQKRNLDKKQVSLKLKEGLKNYFKRDIKYFVFDVVNLEDTKNSIKPILYKFSSDYLYYPMLISGISEIKESNSNINLFLMIDEKINFPKVLWRNGKNYFVSDQKLEIKLKKEELKKISKDLKNLFENGVKVRKISFYGKLNSINKDLMIFPQKIWKRNLWIGKFGKDIKTLQKILINEGVWGSFVGVTGYFGPITKRALIKFQEKYQTEILSPINLKKGTGFFGPLTRSFLKEMSF